MTQSMAQTQVEERLALPLAERPLAVVTGGTGFLGGYLCQTLAEQGWRVRAVSRSGKASSWPPYFSRFLRRPLSKKTSP